MSAPVTVDLRSAVEALLAAASAVATEHDDVFYEGEAHGYETVLELLNRGD